MCNADDEEEEEDDDEDDDEEDTNCGCMRFFLSFPRDFSCSILRFRALAPFDGDAGEELPSGREANDMWGVMREPESPASSRALASLFAYGRLDAAAGWLSGCVDVWTGARELETRLDSTHS